jgi:DNA-binding response OmpR family regulator
MTKVLLAEDDYTMVSLLTTLLGLEGFQVVTVLDKTGDILENIRKEMPDVILMDVHLGDLNGLPIVKELRQQEDLKNIRIIMASGMNVRDDCLAAGANDFLLKPYMPDDLLRLIRAQN